MLTRRRFIQSAGLLATAPSLILPKARAEGSLTRLHAAIARQQIAPADYPETELWAYNGTSPGPVLRFRQGQRARIELQNALPVPTTIHWHGVHVPNGMDGVSGMTQPPVEPGGRFVYDFELHHAGSYWYHPHHRSYEQVGRGLYGAFVVEEANPIEVDRELIWVLSDWRFTESAESVDDFGNLHDVTHGGRVGNAVAINGRYYRQQDTFPLRAGERIRLRLVNACTARGFRLRFQGHEPKVIALDGNPLEIPPRTDEPIVIAPSQRVDLVLDCRAAPGSTHPVVDDYYRRRSGNLVTLAYTDETPLRSNAIGAPVRLAPNPHPEPDPARAVKHTLRLEGGAMGGMKGALVDGKRVAIREMVREHGLAWAINGTADKGHGHRLFELRRGQHCVMTFDNRSAWEHPMHLHGHAFRVLRRNDRNVPGNPRRDTVLVQPNEKVDIAFVADDPGDWMLHCHVLAHQLAGLGAYIRVS